MIHVPDHPCFEVPQVTRFAPSPTGHLHLGHAYSALFAQEAAAKSGGRFILRMEDVDQTRVRAEYEQAIYDDMAWLGVTYPQPAMRQSTRQPAYDAALEKLTAMGVTYPCFCTRREIGDAVERAGNAPHGPDGPHYPGTCKPLSKDEQAARIAAGEPHSIRLNAARAADLLGPLSFEEVTGEDEAVLGVHAIDVAAQDDIVLARKDVRTAYHLSVVVDDAAQGVSLVTRGADLFFAAPVQRVLQALLGYDAPLYAHHRLIRDAAGKRLAKRDNDKSLATLRAEGFSAEEVRVMF